jgi:hypothetical protein
MENSAPDRQQVRVTILSRPYTLLTSGDAREVEEVAASVDELMLSIAAKAPNADSTRIAKSWRVCTWPTVCARWSAISANSSSVDRKSEEFAGVLEQLIEATGRAHELAHDTAGTRLHGAVCRYRLPNGDRPMA